MNASTAPLRARAPIHAPQLLALDAAASRLAVAPFFRAALAALLALAVILAAATPAILLDRCGAAAPGAERGAP